MLEILVWNLVFGINGDVVYFIILYYSSMHYNSMHTPFSVKIHRMNNMNLHETILLNFLLTFMIIWYSLKYFLCKIRRRKEKSLLSHTKTHSMKICMENKTKLKAFTTSLTFPNISKHWGRHWKLYFWILMWESPFSLFGLHIQR